MALSDTCAEVVHMLSMDFVNYADFDYTPSELNRLINGIYSLTEFMVAQDLSPECPEIFIEPGVNRNVIGNILMAAFKIREEDADCVDHTLIMMSNIKKINPRLNNGIESLFEEIKTRPDHFMRAKNPKILEWLTKIMDM